MKLLIAQAYASSEAAGVTAMPVNAPSAGEAFMLNLLLIGILVILFYTLLIVPQQKRYKKHREMIDSLKKGDGVITAGGLLGKVEKLVEGKDEVVIDLGNGVKVTALRSTIQIRPEEKAA